MAREVRQYQVVIPAGTAPNGLATADISFPPRVVERIDWRVPKGNMGLMGWYLASSKAQMLPQQQGQFIVAHGETGYWQLDDLPDSGDWQIMGYNTGTFNHSVFVTFHLGLIEQRQPVPQLISPLVISASADLSHAGPPVRPRR